MADESKPLNRDGTPIRRPLAHRIAEELRHIHPAWTEEEIIAEASAQALAQLRGREHVSYA